MRLPDEIESSKGQAINTMNDATESTVKPRSGRPLSESACLELLPTAPMGRLVYTKAGRPATWLTKFLVEDNSILFTTRDLDVLRAAERGYVVAFEADAVDRGRRLRWTVAIVGHLAVLAGSEVGEPTGLPSAFREAQQIRLAIAATHGMAAGL
jgi:hypothetical protein